MLPLIASVLCILSELVRAPQGNKTFVIYKELALVIVEVEKFQDLQSANWRLGELVMSFQTEGRQS